MADDVALVWTNCRTYNAEDSQIVDSAAKAASIFAQRWAKEAALPDLALISPPSIRGSGEAVQVQAASPGQAGIAAGRKKADRGGRTAPGLGTTSVLDKQGLMLAPSKDGIAKHGLQRKHKIAQQALARARAMAGAPSGEVLSSRRRACLRHPRCTFDALDPSSSERTRKVEAMDEKWTGLLTVSCQPFPCCND